MTAFFVRFRDAKKSDLVITADRAVVEDYSADPFVLFLDPDGETLVRVCSKEIAVWGRKDAIAEGP